jgi:predicted GNAT family acetyltransferase
MSWKSITDKAQLKKLAKSICEKQEAKYSLLYGMILDDVFGSHIMLQFENKAIALQTSPTRPIVISDLDNNQAREFALWLENNTEVKEIVGTKETVNLILDHLRSSEPGYPELLMNQRIYKLENVKKPEIKYHMRQANPKDLKLVSEWFYQFMLDAWVMQNPKRDLIEKMATTRIENNEVYLLVKDGNPVSMACSNRPTINAITVNGVFTPIEHRGNGFAGELVALLSEKLLTEYSFCCLYTDLNSPTSNKIYTNIGYETVCDSLHYKIRE